VRTLAAWSAYSLICVSLLPAVLLRGGVYPQQWEWSALGVSIAALLVANWSSSGDGPAGENCGCWLMTALLGWMALQMVPLPPALVAWLSPERWSALSAARALTGERGGGWAALSIAPGATLEGLLDVAPAMAAFVVARELCKSWRDRAWVLVIPVIAVAWLESMLGLVQFYMLHARDSGVRVTGTYVNPNHFSGLLEISFPLAILWAVSVWRKGNTRDTRSAGPALAAIGLLAVAACLLLGIVFSLSRMGFICTVGATILTIFILLGAQARLRSGVGLGRRWLTSAALLGCLVIFLPTKGLVDRLASLTATEQLSNDARSGIWRDSLHMIAAYRWTGCGLETFEYGFYRFQTVLPMDTVEFAHNDYLEIAAELGLIGAVLAAALGLWITWRLVSVVLWMRDSRNWELAVGVLGALFAIALHSLVDFNLYIPANALAVAWLSGIADSPGLREG
jgi:O-antigen ligase